MSWLELNITPASAQQREKLLADVVVPLLAEKTEVIESWHFFWEPPEDEADHASPADSVLRLRVLTDDSITAVRAAVVQILEKAQAEGAVAGFYEGRHGVRGKEYEGEGDLYGESIWPMVYLSWEAISNLSLTIALADSRNLLETPRSFQWKRHAHLFANQLGLPDARLALEQAQRYLTLKENQGKWDRWLISRIEKYLYLT